MSDAPTIENTQGESCDVTDIACHLSSFSEWLLDALLYVPKWVWQEMLGALAALIEAMPAPDFFATFAGNIGGIAGSVVWFLDLFQFKAGVAMILSALLLRFLIRRIPIIG